MSTTGKPRAGEEVPPDLLPVIRKSGILGDRQFEEIKAKVLAGELPFDPKALANKLIRDKVLTEYQAKRFLSNRPHGLMIDKYVIQDRLGSGSMGRVYKATHPMMGRTVALKIIAPEIVTNARVVSRFQREMKMVGRLDHPHVVRAFDAGQVGQMLYIVMEYVPGESLGQRFRARGALSPTDVVDYSAQAALGLYHAHEQGIVHRDIKPSNLLLNDEGVIKVLDLGLGVLMEADDALSFATADGIAVGTIDYMSPEQACGKEVDGRSDLYSLGCSMYHLMTGKLPFTGNTPVERLGKRISGKPVPILEVRPDLPASLVAVMDRLLANKPGDRYASGAEAAEALQGLTRKKAPKPKEAPPAPPIVRTVEVRVEVRPGYPRWFAPLAGLAERSPGRALAAAIGAALGLLAAGIAAGRWMR